MPSTFIQFPIVINGWLHIHAFIDTGATHSLMSSELALQNNIPIDTLHKTPMNQVQGSLTSIGRVQFQLQIASRTLPVVAHVVEGL